LNGNGGNGGYVHDAGVSIGGTGGNTNSGHHDGKSCGNGGNAEDVMGGGISEGGRGGNGDLSNGFCVMAATEVWRY
jgi:hypothetical protein